MFSEPALCVSDRGQPVPFRHRWGSELRAGRRRYRQAANLLRAVCSGGEFVAEGSGATIETPNIPGGLYDGDPGATPYLCFRVSDLQVALDRVREPGGDVGDYVSNEDADTVARFGRFVTCADDQGSPFGLHQLPAQALPT